MAIIKAASTPPPAVFKAPGHVAALGMLGILCLVAGVVLILFDDVVAGLLGLLQCCAFLIFQAVAEDAAYTRWRLDQHAKDLEVVVAEATAQSNERIIARQRREVEEAERLRKERAAAEAEDD